MDPSSKVRAEPVSITIRVPPDLYGRLDRLRKKTGVPITQFGIRALESALDAAASASRKPNTPVATN